MPSVKEILATVQNWITELDRKDMKTPSPRNKDDVVAYVNALFEEAKSYRQKSLRARFGTYNDPLKLWKDCRKLEAGKHYEVFGARRDSVDNAWRHELVDNIIGDQTRVRKSYITANWHDISISPNIAHLSDVVDQERGKTGWHKNVVLGTHRQLTEGTVIYKSILDVSDDPDGLAREVVCDNESILPSPGSVGFSKIEGCWHVIHATVKTVQACLEENPNLDVSKLQIISGDRLESISMQADFSANESYNKTKFTDHIEVWMDDRTLERAPFDKQELEAELVAVQNGQEVRPIRGQNHLAFIQGYQQTIDQLDSGKLAGTEEDQEFTQNFINYLIELMTDRRELMEKEEDEGVTVGRRRKYPFGRKIVVIGGEVSQDKPNPFKRDWRKYFHKVDCESLPGHFWGRGLAEILWYVNDEADTLLSRIADLTVTIGTPKAYFSIADKDSDHMKKWSNDPTIPGFYTGAPPTFPSGQIPSQLFELYNAAQNKATQAIGVNEVTYGEAPSSRASGKMVDTLLRQNVVMITGEASLNMNDAIEDMIETRLWMYKKYYVEPRFYIINGKEEALRLSELMANMNTMNVNVKPNSNFPNKWEEEMNFVLQMGSTPLADGLPALPREAVIDQIAEQYPQYGRDSQYYQISQVLQLGLQAMKQQQEQAAKDANTQQQIDQKVIGKGIEHLTQGMGEQA